MRAGSGGKFCNRLVLGPKLGSVASSDPKRYWMQPVVAERSDEAHTAMSLSFVVRQLNRASTGAKRLRRCSRPGAQIRGGVLRLLSPCGAVAGGESQSERDDEGNASEQHGTDSWVSGCPDHEQRVRHASSPRLRPSFPGPPRSGATTVTGARHHQHANEARALVSARAPVVGRRE